MKHLSCAPLSCRLLAKLTDIRLGWEGLPGTKHYSLLQTFINYGRKKSFITLGPVVVEADEEVEAAAAVEAALEVVPLGRDVGVGPVNLESMLLNVIHCHRW
jgi:hypothetical protein